MIYFDMDGVLAIYDRDGYVGDKPAYKRAGEHYFLNREPDEHCIREFRNLYDYIPMNVKVLTTVTDDNSQIRNEQTFDKINWMLKYIPEFNFGRDFMAVTSSKRSIIQDIKGFKLMPNDILVDDYNKNLESWKEGGGTAIKYLNGINSPYSYEGPITGDGRDVCADILRVFMCR